MMRTVLLALSARPAMGRAMSRLALTRWLVRRFVAGTRLEDGLAVVERINRAGLDAALTCLGEYAHDAEAAAAAASVYRDALGEDWYGYFMRRLAERPANLPFLRRNLAR